ncbi:hypothetical protein CSAL01_10482 [Colletotrichum salicis]|uniref:Uncharacterized protein n=1 Tax=Colletotrichum salicis TaxID=1209931 RepID=A0A135UQN8_9PEZI|nr:hypothetical protein CSAL01_10482 [Colletotrichum salicis]
MLFPTTGNPQPCRPGVQGPLPEPDTVPYNQQDPSNRPRKRRTHTVSVEATSTLSKLRPLYTTRLLYQAPDFQSVVDLKRQGWKNLAGLEAFTNIPSTHKLAALRSETNTPKLATAEPIQLALRGATGLKELATVAPGPLFNGVDLADRGVAGFPR